MIIHKLKWGLWGKGYYLCNKNSWAGKNVSYQWKNVTCKSCLKKHKVGAKGK